MAEPLLVLEDLHVRYDGPRGPLRAVDGVSLTVERGETYALVGESGCGKSTLALAILGLVEPGKIRGGRVRFDGVDLTALGDRGLRPFRGARIGMVFQEPASALNPVLRVGTQVGEAIRAHQRVGRRELRERVVRWLGRVRLPDPDRIARAYPHELSGGMQQRAMLAVALAAGPELLIADEPTASLDVTIQAQILDLVRDLKREMGLTVLLIAHDLGVVAENADRVGVLYAGRKVEESDADALFREPLHPYTRGLLRAIPAGVPRGERLPTLPGSVPDPVEPPPGCRFHPRCPERFEPCDRLEPEESEIGGARRVSCHLHVEARAPGERR